jgi:hypothetical protein
MSEPVYDTINRTGGLLHRSTIDSHVEPDGEPQIEAELRTTNPLVGLAKQFGEAMGTRKALREAIGTKADPGLLAETIEPHARGSILVAAVFEAYFNVYIERTRDLMRIGRAGGAIGSGGGLHPDLARRLTDEAVKVAGHFLNICIRAIDYCPPVDLQFGEFLRAMITADSDLVPDDPHGYRAALIGSFRRRGIVPNDVVSYSEGSLRWSGPADRGDALPPCRGLLFDILRDTSSEARRANADRQRRNAIILHRYATAHAVDLGLAADIPIRAYSFHPIFRIGPTGRLVIEFVVEFLQHRELPVDPDFPNGQTFRFRGGSTVIFDHLGRVKYVVRKSIESKQRPDMQREFLNWLTEVSAFAYDPGGSTTLNFAAIHRGI